MRNSLFVDATNAMMPGGIVGASSSGTIANCVFTVGGGPASMGYGGLVRENCKKLSSADAQTDAALEMLNKDVPDTGYRWALEGGYPVLVDAAAVEVNKKALQAAVDAAGQVDLSQYEDAGRQAFTDALAAATVQALQAICAYQKAAASAVSWAAVGAVEQGTVDPVTPQPPLHRRIRARRLSPR